jgi:NADH-quinone oxidoreductase subunit N
MLDFESLELGLSLGLFSPEIALCATIVALLLVRLFDCDRWLPTYWVALLGTLSAFGLAYVQFTFLSGASEAMLLGSVFESLYGVLHLTELDPNVAETGKTFFTGLLVFDGFTVFFRQFLLLFLILVIVLTVLTGIPDNEDGPDFYTLLLGSTVGMLLMASANHLLILFLGIEMASVPSYAMVGFLKGKKLSSEASLKFVVYGAGSAGVMLYGISLLAGLLGTASLPEMVVRFNLLLGSGADIADPVVRTVMLAVMMIFVGVAFKLSLVPFHFWCPDAFQGAPAEVAGYLSVASKAAAFALLVRFCLHLVGSDAEGLRQIGFVVGIGLGMVGAATATLGNLAAYTQSNLKRLFAYSTIAHAGYMVMAVAALMVILNAPAGTGLDTSAEAARAIEGLLYYLAVYLFMNLGAFAIVALIRNEIYSEELEDYKGLGYEVPVLSVCMLICIFSLVGIPPMGGFIAKFMIFWSLFNAGYAHWSLWVVLAIAGANTVFSLFYYLRVLRAMFLETRPEGVRPIEVPLMPVGAYVIMISLPILALGIFAEGLSQTARNVAAVLIP